MAGRNSQQKSLWGQMSPMKSVTLHLVTASRTSGLIGSCPHLVMDKFIDGKPFFQSAYGTTPNLAHPGYCRAYHQDWTWAITFRIDAKKAVWSDPTGRKRVSLLLGKELCQRLPEVRLYYFLTTKIHEDLWLKMRIELRQMTVSTASNSVGALLYS